MPRHAAGCTSLHLAASPPYLPAPPHPTAGGTSRLSGVAMSLFLGAGIFAAAPVLGQVPVASLVGVMLLVCYSTFSWSSLRLMRGRIPRTDAAVIVLVSAVTVYQDLAKAVVAGTVVSALSFAWKQSTRISARVGKARLGPTEFAGGPRAEWRTFQIQGPLFFGSTQAFAGLFDPKADPDDVVLDFMESRVCDHSALEAINTLAARYGALGKRVHLRHLSSDCTTLLTALNGEARPYELIEADPATDPVYEVA